MSGRPKDRAISEDEYRRKEADAMQRTADQNRALQSIFGRLRALASDWEANSGSRGLGERSEATAWSKAASQLREAISLSEPQGEPSNRVIVMCARCGLFPVVGGDEINSDIVVCDRCAFAEGWESAQGEPSDASVDAARSEIAAHMNYKTQPTRGAMRAALRAAGVVGQEGESRGA